MYVKFDNFIKIFRGIPNLVKFWQNYLALYMKTEVYFISVSDIKSPQQLSLSEMVANSREKV